MLPDVLFLVLFFGCIAFYSLVVLIISSVWPRSFVISDPPAQLDEQVINPDEGWRLERKIEREGFLWEEEFRRRELGVED